LIYSADIDLKMMVTVKPVYKGQSRELQNWPLLTGDLCSECQKLIFTGQIKTGLWKQETTTRRCSYAQVWLQF